MKMIELKCSSVYFGEVKAGIKTFEIRKNDRDFRVGDIIWLREITAADKTYTNRHLTLRIKYILWEFEAGLQPDHIIMSIEII